MPTSSSAARAARNESVFRDVNEQLEAASSGGPTEIKGFVCECADLACTAVVAVALGAYERVRQWPDRFIVAPDETHVDVTVEKIVERQPEYWVVEKVGPAGEIAEEFDNST